MAWLANTDSGQSHHDPVGAVEAGRKMSLGTPRIVQIAVKM